METLQKRLEKVRQNTIQNHCRIMIQGLGSVGCYLLDYLLSCADESIEIIAVGRNEEKLQMNINIVRVAALIRGQNRSNVIIKPGVDFNDIDQISACIAEYRPDIIVNTSRVYTGLKYGSISWNHIRSYGIWSPLAVKYIRNIMQACDKAGADAIVINTSYSDAVNPWLKSAGQPYPDLGSGNLNHLIPRIQLAAGRAFQVSDYWNIEVVYATSHFHDVVISKEGHAEGIHQLLRVSYRGEPLKISQKELFKACSIPMPSDTKRNMMNASSNFQIIQAVLQAARLKKNCRIHVPGPLGEIGGYPVLISMAGGDIEMAIDESCFTLADMRNANRESIYLDGIEQISDGILVYTEELVAKVKDQFNVSIPRRVLFEEVDEIADFLIRNIIEPFQSR